MFPLLIRYIYKIINWSDYILLKFFKIVILPQGVVQNRHVPGACRNKCQSAMGQRMEYSTQSEDRGLNARNEYIVEISRNVPI